MPLNKNEKKLIIMLASVVFLILNLFGVTALMRKQKDLQEDLFTLRNDRLDAKGWLGEKDMWTQREEWLRKTQPKLQSIGEGNSALLENLQESAKSHSISITDQAFAEPNAQPHYQEIAVKLKVAGSPESITRWLVDIQQPANFQAVLDFSMKADADPTKMICELTVARWYARMQ